MTKTVLPKATCTKRGWEVAPISTVYEYEPIVVTTTSLGFIEVECKGKPIMPHLIVREGDMVTEVYKTEPNVVYNVSMRDCEGTFTEIQCSLTQGGVLEGCNWSQYNEAGDD